MPDHIELAVIGGGPAGLRAAEVAALAGVGVVLYDGKASVGRKFLVAGKGGLNLTHSEAFEQFVTRYSGPESDGRWSGILSDFDPHALRSWAAELGVETFTATSGRVYPKALKAAPLLRRWISRLKDLGVRFEMNHRLTGLVPGNPYQLHFANGRLITADAVVFALGGGSWPGTGSDGAWLPLFETLGIPCCRLAPANCGWEHSWPTTVLETAEGKPLKNISVSAGGTSVTGELLITRYGIEGGAIYQLGAILRAMPQPEIIIDLKPTFTLGQLVTRMESVRRDFLEQARVRWRLGDASHAILARKLWHDAESLARETKHCVLPLGNPRPLAEAISSAGGVGWKGLDSTLMIKGHPGLFAAGEMIDWEAPTGGYLMQGCFATGTRAGSSAAEWLKSSR
jgi:uncharacterized flavoprotein (TIGR03862 family)